MTWAPPPTPPPGSRPSRSTGAAALRSARLRRRTWWLLGAVPVVVALLVLGFKLAFLAPIAAAGADRYAAGDGDGAADTFGIQRTFNLVEPWKAHFNHGTALASTEDTWALYDAITSLDRAYDLAENESPEERCLIQTNLSLTYEIQGDVDMAYADELAAELALVEEAIAARDAGRPYDEGVLDPYGDGSEEPDPAELRQDVQDWYQYAEREYATAEQVRGWPDCGESERTPEEEEQDAAATQRLQDKQQQARDAQPENDGGDTEEGEGSDGDEQSEASGEGSEGGDQQSEAEREEQQRQERLQEQGSEAREEQERLEQEYRDLYGDQPGSGTDPGDGSGGGTKNW